MHPQVELLTAEAEGGSVQAQLDLANAYAAKKRVRDAAKWFEAAAKQGHPEAQFYLAAFLEMGTGGLNRDLPRALMWHRRAAEQGHAGAQFRLGVMYRRGYGTAPDLDEAMKWLRLAAKQGHSDAISDLRQMGQI